MKHVGRIDYSALLLATETIDQQRVNVNQKDSRGLTLAIRQGVYSLLTNEQIDLSLATERGRTALIVAAFIKDCDP